MLEHDEPPCPDCLEQGGLCTRCAKSVLPQLKKPSWIWLIGFKYVPPEKPSAEAEKIIRRKNRKRLSRLARAVKGEFTPAPRKAA